MMTQTASQETRGVYVYVDGASVFPSRSAFLEDFLRGKNYKLLDVGNLGEGEVLVPVRRFVEENGGEYAGLDVNKNLADKLGVTNQFIGDLHDVRAVIPDASFDCIYAGEIIEHSWMPNKMIAECHRILRTDGYLVLDTPNAFEIMNILRLFFFKKDTVGLDSNVLAYHEAKDNFKQYRAERHLLSQPQHKIFYGPAMLRQLLNMHGFMVERFAYIAKPRNLLHRLFLFFFPQSAQKIAIIARKAPLEEIFSMPPAHAIS